MVAADAPALCFLHDFALDSRMWRAQVRAFEKTHRVLTVDLPGFGAQARDIGDIYPADSVVRALDAAAVGQAHIVGLGLGAAVAIDLALQFRSRVASLLLVGPWLVGRAHELVGWQRCVSLAAEGDIVSACELWLDDPTYDGLRRDAAAFDVVRELVLDYPGTHWRGGVALHFHEKEPERRLRELDMPSLVVRGEDELMALRETSAIYAEFLGDASGIEVEGTGHFVNMEAPEAFNELLEEFLTTDALSVEPPTTQWAYTPASGDIAEDVHADTPGSGEYAAPEDSS